MSELAFSTEDKLACALREVRQRERVYTGLVRRGKMSRELAARELRLMRAIAADYQAQTERERLL